MGSVVLLMMQIAAGKRWQRGGVCNFAERVLLGLEESVVWTWFWTVLCSKEGESVVRSIHLPKPREAKTTCEQCTLVETRGNPDSVISESVREGLQIYLNPNIVCTWCSFTSQPRFIQRTYKPNIRAQRNLTFVSGQDERIHHSPTLLFF